MPKWLQAIVDWLTMPSMIPARTTTKSAAEPQRSAA